MDMSNLTSDEAEKLWNDLASGNGQGNAPTASEPPASDAMIEPQANQAAANTEQQANEQAAKQDADQGKQEAAKQGTEDATANAAAPKDPIAELAERFAKIEGQLRNVNGHIGGLTQGQNQLREQMMAAAKQATTQAGGDAPTQAQAKEAMADPEQWAKLKHDFPEWGAAVESLLDARMGGNKPQIDQSAIDRIVSEHVANETAKVREEAVNAHLDGIVDGDWRAAVRSEDFGKWMQTQPDDVKVLGESSALTDASKMLRLFVKSKQANPAAQIQQTRNARLDAAASVPQAGRKAPARKSVDDMSPEEQWEHFAKQRERQRG